MPPGEAFLTAEDYKRSPAASLDVHNRSVIYASLSFKNLNETY